MLYLEVFLNFYTGKRLLAFVVTVNSSCFCEKLHDVFLDILAFVGVLLPLSIIKNFISVSQ